MAAVRERRRRAAAAAAANETEEEVDESDDFEEEEDTSADVEEEELAENDSDDEPEDDGDVDPVAVPFIEIEREARQRLTQAARVMRSQHAALRRLAARFDGPDVPEQLRTEIDFALLWAAWRTGHASAGALAEEFTSEHASSGDLLALAWMVRGEVAESQQDVQESLAAFRFGMNRLGEPIYAYALWRSASVQQEDGDSAGARESLRGVEQAGCEEDAPELVRQLSYEAAETLGHDVIQYSDGVMRPDTCPEPGERSEAWRPEE